MLNKLKSKRSIRYKFHIRLQVWETWLVTWTTIELGKVLEKIRKLQPQTV